jgi:hypothetical protein
VTEHVYPEKIYELEYMLNRTSILLLQCSFDMKQPEFDEFNKMMAGLLAVPHKELQNKQTKERQKK